MRAIFTLPPLLVASHGAGRLACTVRRRQRPDRQLRHRHGQRSAVRRQRPDLSRVGLARRHRPHDAPGPGPHGGAARGHAGGRAGGRLRRHRSAAVGRARHGRRYKITTANERGAGLFRPGAPARLRVQPRRGAARLPQGAEARSRLRHVLLGRGAGARARTSTCRCRTRRWRRPSRRRRRRASSPAKASPREQALIAALATRYAADAKADRAPLDTAYAAAMEKVAAQFPDDNEIAMLYAEVADGPQPVGLLAARRRASPTRRAPPSCRRSSACSRATRTIRARSTSTSTRSRRRTGRSAPSPMPTGCAAPIPGAGHLVHMPSHIYYRVGRYLDALADNKTAVDGRREISRRRPMRRWACIASATTRTTSISCMASAQMAGDGPTVIAAAEKLRGLIPDEVARVIALVQPVKAAPYFAHAQFSAAGRRPRAPRSRRRHSVRQGDVALRARRCLTRAGRFRARPRRKASAIAALERAAISRCSTRRASRQRTC